MKTFHKDFTQQEPIAEDAIQRAVEIMRSGKLHRYNVAPGEESEAALLEQDFAEYMGAEYCLACTSCGMAIFLALKAAGVKQGDKILCNAFTLAPVPGAIYSAGAETVLVEITDNYTIDLEDLERKAASPDTRYLLLSHMRGHLADMEQVVEICQKHNITLIEDCAHTMGASWNGKKSGTFGKAACYSTQTYKHMNSGEGGLLITDDPEVIAKAIINSGSYMLYERHLSRPADEVFAKIKKNVPNNSSRMDNLRASMLRFQLKNLDRQCLRWNERYKILEAAINKVPALCCPVRPEKEFYVGSSIQFSISQPEDVIHKFLAALLKRGVEVKWFGYKEPVAFTSAYSSWEYLGEIPVLKNTDRILATMCDMRVPLTFSLEDCALIGDIINEVSNEVFQ
ncbi:MAG: aminotransferase [Desulfobacterales bacterium]|nr:MAG: aminotransferase [Desulfobacterales bacterium]